jgi:hypothetical protein
VIIKVNISSPPLGNLTAAEESGYWSESSGSEFYQAVEKRPSAAFLSSFAIQRTSKYASWLRISRALQLDIFKQPCNIIFSEVY